MAASASSKVGKIVARLQERISDGEFYEAQQQARVVAARHTKSRNYSAAIDILSSVAQALLRAGQGGSAGDLCVVLLDVYRQAETRPDAESKGRLLACLRLFDGAEPTRKKFIGEMVAWSAKLGDCPAGDPELHHVIGSLYAAEHSPYDAERHLVIGTRESADVLARMEYTWYKENTDAPHMAAEFAARAVLPSLLMGNVRAANTALRAFANALAADNPEMGVQNAKSSTCETQIFPSLPLLNFLSLLLLAVERGTRDVYVQLVDRYRSHLADVEEWAQPMEMIAEMYFGIVKPRQSNPLLDMMGSLFGGGPPAAGGRGGIGGGRGIQAIGSEGLD